MGALNALNVVIILVLPLGSLGLTLLRGGASRQSKQANGLVILTKSTDFDIKAPNCDMKCRFMKEIGKEVKITKDQSLYKALGVPAEIPPGATINIEGADMNTAVAKVKLQEVVKQFGFKEEAFFFRMGRSVPNLKDRVPSLTRHVRKVWYASTSRAWSGYPRNNDFAVRWTAFLDVTFGGAYTFWINSDDGSKLYVDNSLAVNNDGLHGMRAKSGVKTLEAGKRSLKLEFFERGGGAGMLFKFKGPDTKEAWSEGQSSIYYATLVVGSALKKSGFQEEAFFFRMGRSVPNLKDRKPSLTRHVRKVWYASTSGAWPGYPRRDDFAVRWTAFLDVTFGGAYTFWINSDDGSKLYVDNSLAVNNDGLHGMRAKSAAKKLDEGKHSLKLEFFERGGGAGMLFKFKGPDTKEAWSEGQSYIYTSTRVVGSVSRKSGFKEEAYYFNMGGSVPNLKGRMPSMSRDVSEVWYPGTSRAWPGYARKNHFAVRWTAFLGVKQGGPYLFWTKSDDGSKLYIDNSVVVNNDGLHGMRVKEMKKTLNVGEHPLKLEFFEKGGGAGMLFQFKGPDTGNVWSKGGSHIHQLKLAPGAFKEEVFYVATGKQMPSFQGRKPNMVRDVTKVWYASTQEAWDGYGRSNNFAVRWTGLLMVKKPGSYIFWIESDDGSKLYIDNSLRVNNDGLHGMKAKEGLVGLSDGYHSLLLEYYEKGGGAGMLFKFKGPDTGNSWNKGGLFVYQEADGKAFVPINAIEGYAEFGVQKVVPAGQLTTGMSITIIADAKIFEERCIAAGVMAMLEPGDKGTVGEIDKNDGTVQITGGDTTAWVPITTLVGFENWPKKGPAVPAVPAVPAQVAEQLAGPIVPPGPTSYTPNGCSRIFAELDSFIAQNSISSTGMTLGKCFQHCKGEEGMQYFAVTSGNVCFCAPIPPGTHLGDSICDLKCAGDATQSCGGVANAASVFNMIDCVKPTAPELYEEMKEERARLRKAYSSFAGTCGDARDNLCEIKGSSKLSGRVEECKEACSEGNGAKSCHGFSYDALQSECTFYQDVLAGSRTRKDGARCYFKKMGGSKPSDFPLR